MYLACNFILNEWEWKYCFCKVISFLAKKYFIHLFIPAATSVEMVGQIRPYCKVFVQPNSKNLKLLNLNLDKISLQKFKQTIMWLMNKPFTLNILSNNLKAAVCLFMDSLLFKSKTLFQYYLTHFNARCFYIMHFINEVKRV